jgi:hypothetical protein
MKLEFKRLPELRRPPVSAVQIPPIVHAVLESVLVSGAPSRMSRRHQATRTRLHANVVATLPSVHVLLVTVFAILAPRQRSSQ